MIKGGVRKKDYIRRTTEKLAAPSPAFSKAFLLRLKNDGNFCYSNAVVTCLLGNPLVQQFCLEENGFPGEEEERYQETQWDRRKGRPENDY